MEDNRTKQLREFDAELGRRMAELRVNRELRSYEVADYLGIDPDCIDLWEQGEMSLPFGFACTLAELYEVTVLQLAGMEVDEMTRSTVQQESANQGEGTWDKVINSLSTARQQIVMALLKSFREIDGKENK